DSLDEPRWRGVVYHIPTPRAGEPQLRSGSPDEIRIVFPGGDRETGVVEARYARMAARINQLNQDAQRLAPRRPGDPKCRTLELLPGVPATRLPPALGSIDDAFRLADALAQECQRRTRYVQAGLLILVFLAALALGLYSNVAPLQVPQTVLVYLGG